MAGTLPQYIKIYYNLPGLILSSVFLIILIIAALYVSYSTLFPLYKPEQISPLPSPTDSLGGPLLTPLPSPSPALEITPAYLETAEPTKALSQVAEKIAQLEKEKLPSLTVKNLYQKAQRALSEGRKEESLALASEAYNIAAELLLVHSR